MPLYEDGMRSVEGPDAGRGGPEGTAPEAAQKEPGSTGQTARAFCLILASSEIPFWEQ